MRKSRDWGSSTKYNLVGRKRFQRRIIQKVNSGKNVKHKNNIILVIHGKYILLSIVTLL